MKYSTSILFSAATAVAVVNAQIHDAPDSSEDYLQQVCSPTNSSGSPDMNAPCNAIAAIEAQCIYGPNYMSVFSGDSFRKRQTSSDDDSDDGPAMQSNETQRICLCQSQFWNQAVGCFDCYKAHGGKESDIGVTADDLTTISSSYCAASATATANAADYLFSIINSLYPEATDSATSMDSQSSTSISDSIGNKTAVSYYFTPSVTGSAAWVVAQPTGSTATYSSTNVRDGQIVATGTENNAAATGSAGASGSAASGSANATTTGNAGVRQEAAAVAGLFGLAGFVALL